MPSNRGPHPEDAEQFSTQELPRLRAAVLDLSWLRTRQYGDASALKLVGDRYRLTRRQRNAVARSACSDSQRRNRLRARRAPSSLSGREVQIDGFNVLITVEAALGGAYLFVGRDTAYRDVNPLQGTYRIVEQTDRAIQVLQQTMEDLEVRRATWHLDHNVSNVGRVKNRLKEHSSAELHWTVQVERDVDALLKAADHPVVSSDSAVLDEADEWTHLEAVVLARHVPDATVLDLRPDGERSALPTARR